MLTFEELAEKYGVPMMEGARVVYTDAQNKEHEAEIVGVAESTEDEGDYVLCSIPTYFPGKLFVCHPTRKLRYPAVVRRRQPPSVEKPSRRKAPVMIPPRRRMPPAKPPKRRTSISV